MAEATHEKQAPVVIKKYANRRLYNTATSSYVTLEDLSRMVQEGIEFEVYDAKTKENLTRSVLTQIIVEEEQKGQNLLPISFLRQLISFYGDNVRWMVPQYLESAMDLFCRNQEAVRQQMEKSVGGAFPFSGMDELSRQNMALFEQTMRMFNPFAAGERATPPKAPERKAAEEPKQSRRGSREGSIEELRRQLARMQQQLDEIVKDEK